MNEACRGGTNWCYPQKDTIKITVKMQDSQNSRFTKDRAKNPRNPKTDGGNFKKDRFTCKMGFFCRGGKGRQDGLCGKRMVRSQKESLYWVCPQEKVEKSLT